MKVTLNTNIASLKAQGKLGRVTSKLSSTFERLSTGMRINRPGDDPAGLQIADALKAEAQLTDVSIRNMNDALSAINITSAALDSQQQILLRMAELAEQSANGIFSYEQRVPLDKEYQALLQEFDRIAEVTEFNGIKLLRNEGNSVIQIQAGTDGSSNSTLQFQAANSYSLSGILGMRSNTDGDAGVSIFDVTIVADLSIPGQSLDGLASHGFNFKILEVVDSLGQTRTLAVGSDTTVNDFAQPISALPAITQVGMLVYDIAEDGTIREPLRDSTTTFVNAPFDTYSDTVTFSDTGATADIAIDVSELDYEHLDGASTTYENSTVATEARIVSTPVENSAIGFTNVRYQESARLALDAVKNRIDDLSELRGGYGAIQSRLGVAIDTATAIAESVVSAESRIRDADIAAETAELVRLQILQQATTAVLAQANSAGSIALQLIGG